MKTIVGVYDDRENAREVIEDLVEAGYNRSDVSLLSPDPDGTYARYSSGDAAADPGETAAAGVFSGGVLGGLIGVVLGLGAFTIPGVGPIVAAGPLAAGITGALTGAVAGGLIGALVDWGIPEDEAHYYAESVRRGSTMVAVKASEENISEIVRIMNQHNPVNVERRAASWRAQGWRGFDTAASAYSTNEFDTERNRYVDEGYVNYEPRYRSHYNGHFSTTGRDYNYYAPAYRYGYSIAQRSRYRNSDWNEISADVRREWENEYHDSAWDDVKDAIQHGWQSVKDTFTDDDYDYSQYEYGYRTHYTTNYANTGRDYYSYAPAYRFGYDLARQDRFFGRTWNDIESEVRQDWESRYANSPWEDFKDAVHHAWEEVKDAVGADDRYDGDDYAHRFNRGTVRVRDYRNN